MLIFTLIACQTPIERQFPEGFVWGAAVAGFQVDMGCPTWDAHRCEDRASDWYQWVTAPEIQQESELFVSGESVSAGPGMWELWEEDAARMGADGLGGVRLSVEWSRLFPEGAAEAALTVEELDAYANTETKARYHEIFSAIRAQKMRPLVTLNHYTLPLWVHDGIAVRADLNAPANGWLNGPRIERLIALYAGWVAREYGADVDTWATLNEPLVIPLAGFLQPGEDRSNPPGLSMEADAALASLGHQIEASAAMYDAVKAYDHEDADGDGEAAAVGLVLNMVALTPKDPSKPEDLEAVERCDWMYHRLFLDGLTSGAWDDDLDGAWDRERSELAGRLDWIGINYYNQVSVARLPFALFEQAPVMDFYPTFSWDPYPQGLGEVTLRAAEYGLPLWITENGTPAIETQGASIMEAHLASLRDSEVTVQGYFWWSYVDNYEWNHGMSMKFGLYALDAETKARTPREALLRYREIIASGTLDDSAQ